MDGVSQPGVEQQIESRMDVVFIDINLVAAPGPIVAAAEVGRGYHPGGAVFQDDAVRVDVERAGNVNLADVFVTAMRVDHHGVPSIVVIIVMSFVNADFVFFPAQMFAVVMMIISIVGIPMIMVIVPVMMIIAVMMIVLTVLRAGDSKCR